MKYLPVAITALLISLVLLAGDAFADLSTNESVDKGQPVFSQSHAVKSPIRSSAITPTPTCETSWRWVESPNVETNSTILIGVDILAPNDVWAVGRGPEFTTLTMHWDGAQWTIIPSPGTTSSYLIGVSAVASDDVWAVGFSNTTSFQALILRWDGVAWRTVPIPNIGDHTVLTDVMAVAANDVWAVGEYAICPGCPPSNLIMHWDGTQWNSVPSPNVGRRNYLRGVTAISPNDIWAVGAYSTSEAGDYRASRLHWDGTQWSVVPGPGSGMQGEELYDISATSSSDIWAVGYSYESNSRLHTFVEHWNGSAWQRVTTPEPSPTGNTLTAVQALAADEVWAVGRYNLEGSTNYGALIMKWDGAEWSIVPAPNLGVSSSVLADISGIPGSDVWAVGDYTASSGAYQTLTLLLSDDCATPQPTATNTPTPPALTPTPTPCRPGSFSDVPSNHTFYPFVTCLVNRGIVSGYADCTFRPNNQVTRSQLAKIVSNAANFQEDPGTQIFQDVPPGNAFYEWINRLTRRGYMSGYACGSPGEPCINNRPYFRPFANATRAQTSKIVSNAAQYNDPPQGQTFEDVPPTHPFYTEIQRLASRGIMGGYQCGGPGEPCMPGNRPYFRPYNNVTRGQSAKIVANTFYGSCVTP